MVSFRKSLEFPENTRVRSADKSSAASGNVGYGLLGPNVTYVLTRGQ